MYKNTLLNIQELDALAEAILGMGIEPQIICAIDIPANMYDVFKKAMKLDPNRSHLLYRFLEYAVNFSLDNVDIETLQYVIYNLELSILLDDMIAIVDGVKYIVSTVKEKYRLSGNYKPYVFYVGIDILSMNSNMVGLKIYAEEHDG